MAATHFCTCFFAIPTNMLGTLINAIEHFNQHIRSTRFQYSKALRACDDYDNLNAYQWS